MTRWWFGGASLAELPSAKVARLPVKFWAGITTLIASRYSWRAVESSRAFLMGKPTSLVSQWFATRCMCMIFRPPSCTCSGLTTNA